MQRDTLYQVEYFFFITCGYLLVIHIHIYLNNTLNTLSMFIQLILFLFPWKIRKFFLRILLNFDLDENVKIGYSIVLAKKVILKKNAKIGHFNLVKSIDILYLDENSKIGQEIGLQVFL